MRAVMRAATISLTEFQVWLLFEGGYYSGCGFYSNKYGISAYKSQNLVLAKLHSSHNCSKMHLQIIVTLKYLYPSKSPDQAIFVLIDRSTDLIALPLVLCTQ